MIVGVELIGIGKRYKSRELYSSITTSVGAGQCLVISGKNGSGKSTLLKIIAGIIRPTQGKVQFTEVESKSLSADQTGYIGMVSPDFVLYEQLTGYVFADTRGVPVSTATMKQYCQEVGLAANGGELGAII